MIIKCPECGHQVSDKAPVCPSCGVEIAGHLVKCFHCSEIYLKEDVVCPNCHHSEPVSGSTTKSDIVDVFDNDDEEVVAEVVSNDIEEPVAPIKIEPVVEEELPKATPVQEQKAQQKRVSPTEGKQTDSTVQPAAKNNHTALFVSLLIAFIMCAVLLFFYNKGNENHEAEEYEIALKSNNQQVMEQFLEDYPNAPLAHINSIKNLLNQDKQKSEEWGHVVQQNTIAAYKAYLEAHPDTPHKDEIQKKIEELYWDEVVSLNTEAAYLGYREKFPKGIHTKEADEKLKVMLDNTSTPSEEKAAVAAVRQFLQGINSKSTSKIQEIVAPSFNFLGAGGATTADVAKYMREKLYQADVNNVMWHLGTAMKATTDKQEGGGTIQTITIPARLVIERKGGTGSNRYTIKAQMQNGKITSINWILQAAAPTPKSEQ
ncbi:zinc ribbon domain-containing protein [Prevotella intermedia]|uniref:zinc ribbon domain-containing protein n=1 Tax=Prevotella intermedia TaxID=28131 RepID=UPI00077DFC61|nr:zinc ribbon domain-containing protein [Prevotella intermedia]